MLLYLRLQFCLPTQLRRDDHDAADPDVTFRQISLLTLIGNALVLPAQTGVMLFGGLALLTGMVFLPLGQVVGRVAWLFVAWTIQVIHLFA